MYKLGKIIYKDYFSILDIIKKIKKSELRRKTERFAFPLR